jgi:hypothetical protein
MSVMNPQPQFSGFRGRSRAEPNRGHHKKYSPGGGRRPANKPSRIAAIYFSPPSWKSAAGPGISCARSGRLAP